MTKVGSVAFVAKSLLIKPSDDIYSGAQLAAAPSDMIDRPTQALHLETLPVTGKKKGVFGWRSMCIYVHRVSDSGGL